MIWLPRLSGPIDLRWDAGVYYLSGTSLAQGHGYRIPSEPGSPEALQYPPLLPSIIALHERVLGTADPAVVASALRKTYALIFLAFGLSLLALCRRLLPSGIAFLATALCLCQIMTIFISDLLFAELPFVLISVLLLLVATSSWLESRPIARESLSFLLAAAGFLLRTAGLALLGAWVLEALIRRRWRMVLLRGALSLLPVLGWQAHVARVKASDEYAHPAYAYQRAPYQYYNVSYAENLSLVDPFQPELGRVRPAALVRRLTTNLFPMFKAVGETVSTKQGYWSQILKRARLRIPAKSLLPPKAVFLPLLGFATIAIVGLGVLAQRKAWLIVFIVLLSFALAATTPWPEQFTRYFMPISPFLAISAMVGWAQMRSWLAGSGRLFALGRVALIGILVLAFTMDAYAAMQAFHLRRDQLPRFASGAENAAGAKLFYHDETWLSWEKGAAWIKANAPPDAVIATSAPHYLYLLTDRHAVLPPMEADPARAEALLAAVPVSFVIVDKLTFVDVTRRYALPAVEHDPARWRVVYSDGGTKIFERNSP